MATLPTVPAFTAGAPSIATLNQLSQAASFISNCDVRPNWHFYKVGQSSIPATTWTSVVMGTVAIDSDGLSDGTGAVIKTQGWYVLEGCVQIICTTSTTSMAAGFLMTGGGSNPHLGTGVTNRFGIRNDSTQNNTASADTAINCTDITPFCCYPGDTLRLQIWTGAAFTLDNNSNTNYEQGRFVVNFTGQWRRTGT